MLIIQWSSCNGGSAYPTWQDTSTGYHRTGKNVLNATVYADQKCRDRVSPSQPACAQWLSDCRWKLLRHEMPQLQAALMETPDSACCVPHCCYAALRSLSPPAGHPLSAAAWLLASNGHSLYYLACLADEFAWEYRTGVTQQHC